MTKVYGYRAISMAVEKGLELHKHADPIEPYRLVSIDEALEIVREDPNLIYVEVK